MKIQDILHEPHIHSGGRGGRSKGSPEGGRAPAVSQRRPASGGRAPFPVGGEEGGRPLTVPVVTINAHCLQKPRHPLGTKD